MSTAMESQMDEPIDISVGRRVHMLMWDQKLSQTILARRLGVSQSALSKKLHGERGWSLDDLQAIAAALHVSMAYLLGETNVKTPPTGGGGGPKKADSVSESKPLDYKVVDSEEEESSNVIPLVPRRSQPAADQPLRKTA